MPTYNLTPLTQDYYIDEKICRVWAAPPPPEIEQVTGTVHKWGYNENRESCYDKYSPKPSDVRPKASDAHQKVSDWHQKAADGTHEDEESATRLQKMAFKEEMPRTLHPSLFECKLFSVSVLYGWRVASTLHYPSQLFTPLKSRFCGLQKLIVLR